MLFGKNDRALLRGYYNLLHGVPDHELRYTLSQTEIDLLHKFHDNAVAGVYFSNLLPARYKVNKQVRIALFQMFECWQRGKPIPEPESEKYYYHRHSLTLAFSARLNGATDREITSMGFTDDDINKLNNFLLYVNDDMTLRDRIRKTGMGEHSIRKMMKIYQERQVGMA